MDVKIYIDKIEVDYSENQNLPFVLRIAYRDFRKIGETEAIDVMNAATSLPLPATKKNQNILEGNENKDFSFEVTRNGQNFFLGRCRIVNKSYKRSKLISYNLELFGGTADIFERLEGVSLRDLDLGQITYAAAAVTNSWVNQTSDSNLAIFLPSVYGQLNSGTVNRFELEDMRPSVYYETILKGIEDYLEITINSSLRGTDYWKRCLHLFGVGELWENALANTISNNQISDGTVDTLTYIAPVVYPVIYKVEVNVPAGNNAANDLNHLEINSSTGYNQYIAYDATNGNDVVSAEIEINSVGQSITLEGFKTGGSSSANLPAGTQFLVRNTSKVIPGSLINIASCLHDITVKDWLKDLFLQFNLVSFYNPVTKTLDLDPAFAFTIDGVHGGTYQGFYKTDNPRTIKADTRESQKAFQPLFDSAVFNYKADEATEPLINQFVIHTDHPLNCIHVHINEGKNTKDYESIYSNVANGLVDGITTAELPILVDSDVDLLEGAAAILEPTFITEPKNAILSGEIFSGFFEGVNVTTMPIARQNNLRGYRPYTLTFSDAEGRTGGNSETHRGLISIFYNQYFSILSRLEILTLEVEIENILDPETYRNVYKIDGEFYILIELKKVNYNTTFCEGVFAKYDLIREDDSGFYENFNPTGALQILNII